MQTFFKLM
ncbi:putative d-lactate dehydrognease 2, partial [Danaus plexippus plexippus]